MTPAQVRIVMAIAGAFLALAAFGMEQPWKARIGYSALLVVMTCAVVVLIFSLRKIGKALSGRGSK